MKKGSKWSEKHREKVMEWHNNNIDKVTEVNRKIAEGNLGENNCMWKGSNVSYKSLHEWVRRHKSKVLECQKCEGFKSLQLANISGKYKRDVTDYKWLCRKCHAEFDNVSQKMIEVRKNKQW